MQKSPSSWKGKKTLLDPGFYTRTKQREASTREEQEPLSPIICHRYKAELGCQRAEEEGMLTKTHPSAHGLRQDQGNTQHELGLRDKQDYC